jgi:hypothetical protein
LQNLDTRPQTAAFRGLLKGVNATPQHHTQISINGYLVDDHTWSSTGEYLFSIDIPQSYLIDGTNTITVTCPRDGDITIDRVLVNWFEIDYYHSYTSANTSRFNRTSLDCGNFR